MKTLSKISSSPPQFSGSRSTTSNTPTNSIVNNHTLVGAGIAMDHGIECLLTVDKEKSKEIAAPGLLTGVLCSAALSGAIIPGFGLSNISYNEAAFYSVTALSVTASTATLSFTDKGLINRSWLSLVCSV